MNDILVKQSNDLIRNISAQGIATEKMQKEDRKNILLSLQQKRIIVYLISKSNIKGETFPTVVINFQQFCELMNISPGGKQFALFINAVKELESIIFWIDSDKGSSLCRWIEKDSVIIDKIQKNIYIRLSDSIMPYILNLKSNYTEYPLIKTVDFKSKYSYRLYEYIYSYIDKGICLISVEKFIKDIAEEKYDKVFDIERRIISKALKEINEYSDIEVSYYRIYNDVFKKNKVTHFEFIASKK